MRRLIILICALLCVSLVARAEQREVEIPTSWGKLSATLAQPAEGSDTAVLIVAGSGPTDRNGNSQMSLTTYCYKMLSDALVERGIAVLRYDKRGVGLSRAPQEAIASVVIGDFVDDAQVCVDYLHGAGYRKIVVVGHSEGGDIAMQLALREGVKLDGLVLLCAAGYSMDTILMRQLSAQLVPTHLGLMATATKIIQRLKRGEDVAAEEVPKELVSLFHPSVQPFVRSCMANDPQRMAAQIELPMLILTGGRDIQVTPDNGESLMRVAKRGRWVNFENMSHVLKDATTNDRIEQLVSVYTNSQLPLSEGLVAEILTFINQL